MKNYSLPIFNCLFLLLLLYWQPISVTTQTGEEPEFNYIEGSPKGPEHWGELKPEWKLCKIGHHQSPIDILYKDIRVNINQGDLRLNYKVSNAIIKNTDSYVEFPASMNAGAAVHPYCAPHGRKRDEEISVRRREEGTTVNRQSFWVEWVGDAGSIQIDYKQYSLSHCHWHSPAEHLINGKRYDLELHVVHENTSNQVSVVRAQFYQIGEPDSFLTKFTEELKTLVNNKGERAIGVIDPIETNTNTFMYYRYDGSLTTPPCNESVTWIVNGKINTVSSKQLQLLREANFDFRGEDNARPVQALNDRKIFLW